MGRVLPFIFVAIAFVVFFAVDAHSRKSKGEETLWNEARTTIEHLSAEQPATAKPAPAEAVAEAETGAGPSRSAPVMPMPVAAADPAPAKPAVRRMASGEAAGFGAGNCFLDGSRRRCRVNAD